MSVLVKLFKFTVPVPILWAIIVLGVAWMYDRQQVRKSAVQGYVQQSILAEAEAKAKFQASLLEKEREKTAALTSANNEFMDSLNALQLELSDANEVIDEISSQPVNPACVVDQPLYDRLRSQ